MPGSTPRPEVAASDDRNSSDSTYTLEKSARNSYEAQQPHSITSLRPKHNTSATLPRSSQSRSRTSQPSITVHDPDASSPYEQHDEQQSVRDMEEERRLRKRDYAIQISRIMGDQLVKKLNPRSGHGTGG